MSAKVKNWLTGGIECPLEDVTLRLLSKQQCVCGRVTVDYFLDLPLRTHSGKFSISPYMFVSISIYDFPNSNTQ